MRNLFWIIWFFGCSSVAPLVEESSAQFTGAFDQYSGLEVWFSADSLDGVETCEVDIANDVTELSTNGVQWDRVLSGNFMKYNCDTVGVHDSFQWGTDDDPESFVTTNSTPTNQLTLKSHTVILIMFIATADPDAFLPIFGNNGFALNGAFGFRMFHDTRASSGQDDNLRVDCTRVGAGGVVYTIDTDNTFSTQAWHLVALTFDSTLTTDAAKLRVDGTQVATSDKLAGVPTSGGAPNFAQLGARSDNPALDGLYSDGGEIHTFATYDTVLTVAQLDDINCWFQFEFLGGPSCTSSAIIRRRGLNR